MEHINIIGGSSYVGSRRPVGKYGGQYIHTASGLHSGPRQYTTFTNTRWQPIPLSKDSALRQAAGTTQESFIPRVQQPSGSCAVGSSHNGECGEAINNILSKFSSDLTSPSVFGPPAWFTYHNGSAHLPESLSKSEQIQMYNFVQGIPLMTPCGVCQPHASKYIRDHDAELREAIKTRDGMFEWFVDFHNFVNARNGKPQLSLTEARTLYRVDNQCTIQL